MTEREMILNILNRIGLEVIWQSGQCIEFKNGYGHEDIVIDFNEQDDVVNIGC